MRASLLSCGRCGRPRGLVHECGGRRKGPAFRLGLAFTCGTCGKSYTGSPLGHECAIPSDFRRRLAAQRRSEKAEKRRRKRKAATARRRARAKARRQEAAERRKQAEKQAREQEGQAPRPRSNDRERHDYQACADPDCSRYPCRVYREGRDNGRSEGRPEGYAAGYADGVRAATDGAAT
jgi:hypothetical protein